MKVNLCSHFVHHCFIFRRSTNYLQKWPNYINYENKKQDRLRNLYGLHKVLNWGGCGTQYRPPNTNTHKRTHFIFSFILLHGQVNPILSRAFIGHFVNIW